MMRMPLKSTEITPNTQVCVYQRCHEDFATHLDTLPPPVCQQHSAMCASASDEAAAWHKMYQYSTRYARKMNPRRLINFSSASGTLFVCEASKDCSPSTLAARSTLAPARIPISAEQNRTHCCCPVASFALRERCYRAAAV